MNFDTPSIASSTYASTSHALGTLGGASNFVGINSGLPNWAAQAFEAENEAILKKVGKKLPNVQQNQEIVEMTARRLVKVIIVDPNENIPLADCVLYSGEEKLTDATDQELFFEVDIKQLLDAHNAKRTKVIDKKVKERTEHLEPAKIRELKMVVVNIASF